MPTKQNQPAAKAKPAAPKRFTPELIAEAAKLRESGLTWDQIGVQLDVRSTGLLSKRVREAATPDAQPAAEAKPQAKPAKEASAPSPRRKPAKKPATGEEA